jgi:sialic acid synthase SpsE
MIDAAREAGATIVKFQHYEPVKLLGADSPYLEYATQCQFTKEQHKMLKQYCDKVGMEYLVSVFDIADIPWADSLCMRHKVASRMNQYQDFINTLLRTDKQVIISTQGVNPLPLHKVDYMYCVTKYPASLVDMERLPCSSKMGLSSHCPSIVPSLYALAQGANFIEQHVTFSRGDKGCDHSSSITFSELKLLIDMAYEMDIIR